jgi:hypothetical protein
VQGDPLGVEVLSAGAGKVPECLGASEQDKLAVVAATGRVLMDKEWMTGMSAMVVLVGRASRMSLRSLDLGAGARSGDASSLRKVSEAAKGGFLGGGDARPEHNTAQYPFRSVMAQRGMCSKGQALHQPSIFGLHAWQSLLRITMHIFIGLLLVGTIVIAISSSFSTFVFKTDAFIPQRLKALCGAV